MGSCHPKLLRRFFFTCFFSCSKLWQTRTLHQPHCSIPHHERSSVLIQKVVQSLPLCLLPQLYPQHSKPSFRARPLPVLVTYLVVFSIYPIMDAFIRHLQCPPNSSTSLIMLHGLLASTVSFTFTIVSYLLRMIFCHLRILNSRSSLFRIKLSLQGCSKW